MFVDSRRRLEEQEEGEQEGGIEMELRWIQKTCRSWYLGRIYDWVLKDTERERWEVAVVGSKRTTARVDSPTTCPTGDEREVEVGRRKGFAEIVGSEVMVEEERLDRVEERAVESTGMEKRKYRREEALTTSQNRASVRRIFVLSRLRKI